MLYNFNKGKQIMSTYLTDDTVQVCKRRPLNVQFLGADVVECLVVHNEGAVCVVHALVRCQHTVVRLHNRAGHLQLHTSCLSWVKLGLGEAPPRTPEIKIILSSMYARLVSLLSQLSNEQSNVTTCAVLSLCQFNII